MTVGGVKVSKIVRGVQGVHEDAHYFPYCKRLYLDGEGSVWTLSSRGERNYRRSMGPGTMEIAYCEMQYDGPAPIPETTFSPAKTRGTMEDTMIFEIGPCDESWAIPESARCQEASISSDKTYVPCGNKAVAVVHHDKDRRSYYMCAGCASHNLRNRGGKLIRVMADWKYIARGIPEGSYAVDA